MIMLVVAVSAPTLGAILASLVSSLQPRRALRAFFGLVAVGAAILALPHLDRLAQLFAVMVSVLSYCALLFSISIFPKTDMPDARWATRPAYFILLGLFWSSMLVAVSATSFVGIWIGISATTLATTFLVGFSGGKTALEAAWKYLILCSFGIAFALLGMLLLGRAAMEAGVPANSALTWAALAPRAASLPAPLVTVAVLVMALGFATKAGLVPMHAWLPDAHSKAPAAISALLSGLLVSCALYAIVRVQSVTTGSVAHAFDSLLLILGSLSVLGATTLMPAQRDVKRLLSYSSIEHSGFVALALGLHTPLALFAALFHLVNHAFSKSSAFLATGVIQYARGTTSIGGLKGLWNEGRGRLFLASLVALAGLPPFGMFFSELLIVIAIVQAHAWLVLAVALVAMFVGFAALARAAIETEAGNTAIREGRPSPRLALSVVTLVALGAIACAFIPVAWAAFP